MKNTFYIILLLITVSSCTKETVKQNDTIEEPIFENVIYLNFNGEQLQNNYWNNGDQFYLSPAGLSGNDQRKVIDKVRGYFSQFKVSITDKESIYNMANAEHRQRVILTTTYQWNVISGHKEGTAIINSFGTETPCFLFTSQAYFNPEAIAIFTAHEIGHTLGLYHQSEYDSTCHKIHEFRPGSIMGVVDSRYSDHWTVGQSSLGCDSLQNDIQQMASILSFK